MSRVGTFLLVHVFTAVLPPLDPDDRDFYEVMGLLEDKAGRPRRKNKNSVKLEDIRKAYKKKSLQLHPDKIAQRGGNAEDAAAEYELVQEAYHALVDPKMRKRYHALQCSPTRYRFVTNGSLMNPMALQANLSKASFCDKTRIVLLIALFFACLLLQPVLIAIKVNHMLENNGGLLQDVSWTVLLIPLWIFHGQYIIFMAAMTTYIGYIQPPSEGEEKTLTETRISMSISTVESIAWYVGEFSIALKWDDGLPNTPYAIVLVPIFVAILLQWLQYIISMKNITRDMNMMISEIYFKDEILGGSNMQDLSEEDRKALEDKYIIIQTPPEVEILFAEEADMDPKLKDQERIYNSPQYSSAKSMYKSYRNNLLNGMIFYSTFWVLLVLKVDNIALQNASWWIIFIPVLVSLGLRMLYSCLTCCCYISPAELAMHEAAEEMRNSSHAATDEDIDEEDQAANEEVELVPLKPVESMSAGEMKKELEGYGVSTTGLLEKREFKEAVISARDERGLVAEAQTTSSDCASMEKKNNEGSVQSDPKLESASEPYSSVEKDVSQSADESNKAGIDDVPEKMDGANGAGNSQQDHYARQHSTSSSDKKEDAADGNDKNEADKKDKDTSTSSAGKSDDDDASFVFDEETFHAFQSAYAEAESSAMEKRAKAQALCCSSCFQLLLLCLFLAKLNAAYEAEENNDTENIGFNALWILFPFFLFSGIIVCCCACVIYVAGSVDNLDELMKKDQQTDGEAATPDEEDQEGGAAVKQGAAMDTVFAPPPPQTEPDLSAGADAANASATKASQPGEVEITSKTASPDEVTAGGAASSTPETTTPPPPEKETDDIDMHDLD